MACAALQAARAFVPGAPLRAEASASAAAVAATVAASAPAAAEAFVYNGKEYFDITFGISPLAWFCAAFAVLFYGATLKNAALKYNKPYGTNTIANPEPIIGKGKKFIGAEVENGAVPYNAKIKFP